MKHVVAALQSCLWFNDEIVKYLKDVEAQQEALPDEVATKNYTIQPLANLQRHSLKICVAETSSLIERPKNWKTPQATSAATIITAAPGVIAPGVIAKVAAITTTVAAILPPPLLLLLLLRLLLHHRRRRRLSKNQS